MKMNQVQGVGGVVLALLVVIVVFGLGLMPAVGRAQTVPTRTPTPGPATATPTPGPVTATPTPDEPPSTATPGPTATNVSPTNTPAPSATSTQVATTVPVASATATGTPGTVGTPAVTVTGVPAVITLTLAVDTAMVVPGQVVTFTAMLTNTATAALADLAVVLDVPSELTVISTQVAEGQVVTEGTNWQIPVLAPGRSATLELLAAVSDSVPAGTVLDVRAEVLDQQAVVSLGLPPAFLPRVGEAILDFRF